MKPLPKVLIRCSLCMREWPSSKSEIKRRKRLECPNCGARFDTKQVYHVGTGRVDHYGTGAALPETG